VSRKACLYLTVLGIYLFLGFAPAPVQAANILYVKPSAGGSGDCGSWADACALQTAIDAAAPGDEIWVAAGVHKPTHETTPGDARTATFQLASGVAVYGGFSGAEIFRHQRDWLAHETILSGDIGVQGDDGDNAYHVVTGSGADATAILDGFTVTAGNADGVDLDSGGGGMHNEAGSPTVRHALFVGNYAQFGGGMFNGSSSPVLVEVTFQGNSAMTGGGMDNSYSSPVLVDVTFRGNTSTDVGGMSNLGGSPILVNVVFAGNMADDIAGGMNSSLSDPSLANVIFTGNSARLAGGLYTWKSSPSLANVTFSRNTSTFLGAAIYSSTSGNPVLDNCLLWGNTAPSGRQMDNDGASIPTIAYSDIQGSGGSGISWDGDLGVDGGGNIDADPLFVDADGPDGIPGTMDDWLRLRSASPAIDAGDNDAVPADTLDLDGDGDTSEQLPLDMARLPRFADAPIVPNTGNGTPPIVDIGAYEARPVAQVLFIPLIVRDP
jgi:predicted outer membrane repeat protein